MKTNFIPFSELKNKNLIEHMFDNLNASSTNNNNHRYVVIGYDCEKYICQYNNEEITEIMLLIAGIIDEMRRAKANGFNKVAFANIINQPDYDNVYKSIDCFKRIASPQMLNYIRKFMSIVHDKNLFKLCIIEFTIMHGISWLYLQLLESDNYDTCKELAVELLNIFLAATGEKQFFPYND